MARKKTVTTVIDEDGPGEVPGEDAGQAAREEQEDLDGFMGLDARLRVLREQEDLDKAGFTASLYRFDPLNKKKKSFCWDAENSVLSQREVGMEFGPGDYVFLLSPKDRAKKLRSLYFTIDKVFLKLRKDAGLEDNAGPAPGRPAGVADSLELLRSLIEMIRPLLPAPGAPGSGDGGMIAAQMKMFMAAMQETMADNLKFIRQIAGDYRQQALELPGPKDEGEDVLAIGTEREGLVETLERLWPMIEPFVKRLLSPGHDESQAAADMIKGNPEFKKIMANQKRFSTFVSVMDQRLGKNAVDEALKKIGVVRP